MNLFILFVLLIIISYLALKNSKKMLASPFLIFTLSFLVAVAVCVCTPNWIFNPTADMLFVVVACILCFGMGQVVLTRCNLTSKLKFKILGNREVQNRNGLNIAVLLQIFCVAVWCVFFLSKSGGLNINSIKNVRTWMLYNSLPNYMGQTQLISKAIAMIAAFDYIKGKFEKTGQKYSKKLAFLVLAYVFQEVISTSRSGIIYFCCYIIVIIVFYIYKKAKITARAERQAIKIILIITSIVLVVFLGLGYLSRKTELLGITNMVSVYFGGSIYNLDYYLQMRDTFVSPSWGYFTMPIVKSVMSNLGYSVVELDKYYFPFVDINLRNPTGLQTKSNLYTCIVKPMTDFGYFGAFLFFFLLGIFYCFLYKKVTQKGSDLSVIYYAYFMIPVFSASAEYVFGTFLFSPMAIYTIIYILFFYILMHKKSA